MYIKHSRALVNDQTFSFSVKLHNLGVIFNCRYIVSLKEEGGNADARSLNVISDDNVKYDSMLRFKDFRIFVLVPSPAVAPQVTAGRLRSLSVPPVPGRESTACFSPASAGVAKY